ncbi:hypothetical protein QTP88_005669 [Uroleucon formosanum]
MIRSGKSPPRTPTSSKRMLSSTSNSPLHERKKTKTFISPNRFAVLASDDDSVFDAAPSFRDGTVVSSPHTMDYRTEPLAPSLYIRNIINFSAFKNVLIKTVGLDRFTLYSMARAESEIFLSGSMVFKNKLTNFP